MLKKILIVAAIAVVAYLLIILVPQWIGEKDQEQKEKVMEMEKAARERAGAQVENGGGESNIMQPAHRARANERQALDRSVNESGGMEQGEAPAPAEAEP